MDCRNLGRVALHFNDGELRAEAKGGASANVNRAATLPADIQNGSPAQGRHADAAIDPMADPQVRETRFARQL